MNRDQLEQQQIPLYFVAVAAAAVAGIYAPGMAPSLSTLVTPAIAVLMYAMFLQIPFLDLRQRLGNGRFMAALLMANFVFIPVLVWALTQGLGGHPAIFVGALLVLLTPCIDYVVVFTHLGKGDARLTLAATPLLLLLQLLLLPLYLAVIVGPSAAAVIAVGPFVEAFVLLIALPLLLAVASVAGAKRSPLLARWNSGWAWMPVPAMAAVLVVVVGAQIAAVVNDFDRLLPVIPVYLAFACLAPLVGAATAWACKLPPAAARSVAFSASTRNSLVVLPLALALPEDLRGLAAAAVITQTLVELVAELVYIRVAPTWIWPKA